MKVKRHLEKYINFSLISNCIVFNTLAGCKGKGNKGGKGCSESGKDKNQSNTTGEGENELSPEEKARKKKEAEEKAKELAKDQAALDAKKQELIKLIDTLEPRITKLNTSEYNDLRINDIITKDQINLADAKTIVGLEDKINKLNDKITKNEETLAKYEELKNKKNNEFYPRFNGLQEKMDIINNLNGCTIKVDSTIITKKMIDDSKYEDMANITILLTNFENEIINKFEAVKDDLKKKNGEIKEKKGNFKCQVRDLININYTEQDINECNFDKLREIYKDIKFYYDISKAQPSEIKEYFSNRFKKIKSVFDFFITKEKSKKTDLENYKKIIDAVQKIDNFNTNVLVFNNATNGLKNIENILDNLINDYNKNYKKRLEDSTILNDKLTIELKYVEIINTISGEDIEETYYDHKIEKIFSVNKTEINEEIITIDYNKSTDQLNSIETKIENLEANVEKNKNKFIDEITKTFDFLKNAYEYLCDLSAYSIDNTDVDSYKDSTNTLFEKIKTELKKALSKAKNISGNIALEPELEVLFKKFNVYSDKDKVDQIPTEYLVYENYFDSNNQDSDKIKTNVKNLIDSLKKCDQDILKKKILANIKNLVHTYKEDIKVDYILHNIVISKIKKESEEDFSFYKDESSKEYETEEFVLTSDKFSITAAKIIFPKEISDDNLEFDKMKEIIENFELLFIHNAVIFKKIKEYFSKCKIKNFVCNIDFKKILSGRVFGKYDSEEKFDLKTFIKIRDINIDEYFKNYLDINLYCSIYSTENHKNLNGFENIVKNLPDLFSKCYFKIDDKFNFCKNKNSSEYIDIEMKYVIFNPDILKLILSQFVVINYNHEDGIWTDHFETCFEGFDFSEIDKFYKKYIATNKKQLKINYYYNILNIKDDYYSEELGKIPNIFKGKDNIIIFANLYNYLKQIEHILITYRLFPKNFTDDFYFDKKNKEIVPKDIKKTE